MSQKKTPLIMRLRPLLKRMNGFMRHIYSSKFPGRRIILLLTTTGRKSGQPRVTPLQYELIDGFHYIASGWGRDADWVRNINRDPKVTVQVGGHTYPARAEPINDPERIADFLEVRLKRHPLLVGAMLRAQGLPLKYERRDLEILAQDITPVKLIPLTE
ncbi:MAG: nitroreductase family deazaflavin-dependent oxidoreductase [Anaerolineaceae bacterium]